MTISRVSNGTSDCPQRRTTSHSRITKYLLFFVENKNISHKDIWNRISHAALKINSFSKSIERKPLQNLITCHYVYVLFIFFYENRLTIDWIDSTIAHSDGRLSCIRTSMRCLCIGQHSVHTPKWWKKPIQNRQFFPSLISPFGWLFFLLIQLIKTGFNWVIESLPCHFSLKMVMVFPVQIHFGILCTKHWTYIELILLFIYFNHGPFDSWCTMPGTDNLIIIIIILVEANEK